jgi:hypothetical protein
MFTIEQIMKIRSTLINILNHSGLTIEVALLLVKDIYNELYIASLESQMAQKMANKEFSTEETIGLVPEDNEEVTENGK